MDTVLIRKILLQITWIAIIKIKRFYLLSILNLLGICMKKELKNLINWEYQERNLKDINIRTLSPILVKNINLKQIPGILILR